MVYTLEYRHGFAVTSILVIILVDLCYLFLYIHEGHTWMARLNFMYNAYFVCFENEKNISRLIYVWSLSVKQLHLSE